MHEKNYGNYMVNTLFKIYLCMKISKINILKKVIKIQINLFKININILKNCRK